MCIEVSYGNKVANRKTVVSKNSKLSLFFNFALTKNYIYIFLFFLPKNKLYREFYMVAKF